jgi:hypothetical protein
MSLLEQDSPEKIDDAARGEEFTKGTTHLVWTGIVAAILVTAAIATYMIVSEKPPAAIGEVLQVWSRSIEVNTPAFDANGEAMAHESYEQVLVIAHVTLHNQSQQPLFLHQILTNATLADGIHSSYAASPSDFERIFAAYPQLSALHGKALPLETTINPGQSLEGTIVSAFRMNKQQWDARKDLNFSFGFRYQPSLVLAPHDAVIE